MANIKSAKKRIKVIETKTLRNRMIKSALKTAIKKFEVAITSGNAEEAKTTFVSAVKALDMAASKGVVHKNKAARSKSRLSAKLKSLTA
ncbi:30S ribosomal protein S20 [Clostridium sp. JS66]|uniref:30S ribosomal protein S20 n=1 Tax=Clostridium sp. JS66 TaxID=3064705 RepID=UPI00298E5343|nr:30S ribosomal protein S20 [Clostridium sp. JS66]WPC42503.1 30S ribosomal protein S20 [Clostridium sp. JS66]